MARELYKNENVLLYKVTDDLDINEDDIYVIFGLPTYRYENAESYFKSTDTIEEITKPYSLTTYKGFNVDKKSVYRRFDFINYKYYLMWKEGNNIYDNTITNQYGLNNSCVLYGVRDLKLISKIVYPDE